jgi:Family of unknown function (DUF5677)
MPTEHEILTKYDTELQEYVRRVDPLFTDYLAKERTPYQPVLQYLFKFYFFMSYLVENGLVPNDDKNVALRVILGKASLSLFAIYNLLNNGILTEASSSLRSLFEVYVNLKLILDKDVDVRMKLFENFEIVEKWNNLNSNLDLMKAGNLSLEQFDKTMSPSTVRKIQSDYESIKADYHPRKPFHWAWKIYSGVLPGGGNPSLRFIADKMGLSFDYVKVYSPTSIAVHGSANLVNVLSSGSSISIAPQFRTIILSDACITLDYGAKIIELLLDYFKFPNTEEIKVYITYYVFQAMKVAEKSAP